jgi:copper chaperone
METVQVKGMTCNHCVMAVRKALEKIDGVYNVDVNLESGQARFEAQASADMKTVKKHMERSGYQVD